MENLYLDLALDMISSTLRTAVVEVLTAVVERAKA